jgi:BirA family transcriptional regulator, biotin operon repressor / biotin---[acetyl-CoA-carboxylase] ligase
LTNAGVDLPALTLPAVRKLSSERFLSGEDIARQLGCSRASVNNAIAAAQQAGLEVHAIRGRGYRLAMPVSWLEPERIAGELTQAGIQLDWQEQLDSTNARAMHRAAGAAPHRSLVCTEWQSRGRGRRGRSWLGGLGSGLAFSFLWRSARPASQLSGLSLAVGVALVRGLREFGLNSARVKWPNDIQVDGAKLAGVLIELTGDNLSNDVLAPCSAVIGIGLNVAGGAAISQRVGQPVTDLSAHLGAVDRNALLMALVGALDSGLQRFELEGFSAFHDEWHRCHAYQALPVSLITAGGDAIDGVMLGVDAEGALLLRTADGVSKFHSGEVSLRASMS